MRRMGQNDLSLSYGSRPAGARFGGHPEGVLGACPFEALHQFQLGMLKYILLSLFNYRTIPVASRSGYARGPIQTLPSPPPPARKKQNSLPLTATILI